MGQIKISNFSIVTDIKKRLLSQSDSRIIKMQSADIFRKCLRLVNSQKILRSPICTSVAICGKNKYTTPVRDIMIESENTRNYIKETREIMGFEDPNKNKVNIYFENRNPRHMELMGYNKPAGFTTLYEKRNFYNKLHLEITNRHVKAYVENVNGHIVCYASTTEFAIAKRLHCTTDVTAVVNIARVLAERLKKTGLLRVSWWTRNDRTTEKVREFEGILKNSGILLTEAPTKVLQGKPETLPPAKQKRTLPTKVTAGIKRTGTIMRKDKAEKWKDRY